MSSPKEPVKKTKNQGLVALLAMAILVASLVGAAWHFKGGRADKPATESIVPANIKKSVNFPFYYPDPAKLPTGYYVDINSFRAPGDGVAVYTVRGPNNKDLAFSLQTKPSSSKLASFNKQYLPIHRQVLTQTGTATEGAIGDQTTVSLPVDADNVWILITGPPDIYATDSLAQVLKAIKKD